MANNSIQNIALDFIEHRDNKTLTILMKRLRPGLNGYVYKFVKDIDLTKQIVAQTFINVWERIHQYNPKYSFSTWVYNIAKYEALGSLRHSRRNLSHETLSDNHSKVLQYYTPVCSPQWEIKAPVGEELHNTLYEFIKNDIKQLDKQYYDVIYYVQIKEMQLQEVANKLKIPLSTVKTRLTKARKDIAKIMYKKYPELMEAYHETEN